MGWGSSIHMWRVCVCVCGYMCVSVHVCKIRQRTWISFHNYSLPFFQSFMGLGLLDWVTLAGQAPRIYLPLPPQCKDYTFLYK